MKKHVQLLISGKKILGVSFLIGIVLISNLRFTKKTVADPNHDLAYELGRGKDKKEKPNELSPEIVEHMNMTKTTMVADTIVESKTTIDQERRKALARKEEFLTRLTPSQRQIFLKFEVREAIGFTKNRQARASSSSAVEWKSRGPGNVPGPTRDIVVMPNDPTGNTWLIGTVRGGVWKTTDGGVTWENLTDDLPFLATSYLTVSAANPDVIYVGIGEPHVMDAFTLGRGVFKSTDGGDTWVRTPGSENFGQVSRMVSDPEDENIVVVATTRELVRTTDGGQTWTDVSPTGVGSLSFQDLKVFEGDFNIQHASGVNVRRNQVNIYKSTDGGASWVRNFATFERFPSEVPGDQITRIEFALSRTNPDRIYASLRLNRSSSLLAISRDGGDRFSFVREAENIYFNFLGDQGDQNNAIMVHPFNDDVVYVGGVQMYRYELNLTSTGSQAVRTEVSTPYDSIFGFNDRVGINVNVPTGHHTIKAILGQGQNFRIINANDGGISLSDEGENPGIQQGSWNHTEAFFLQEGNSFGFDAVRGVVSSQVIAATKVNGQDRYLGAMQNNSSYLSASEESANANTAYRAVSRGDGYTCIANYANPNEILSTEENNTIFYSSDGGETSRVTSGSFSGEGSSPFSWIANSNHFPNRVFSAQGLGVEISQDFGQTWKLTPIRDVIWASTASVNVRIAVSDCNPNVVAATTLAVPSSNTLVPIWISSDGGETFELKTIDNLGSAAFNPNTINTSPTNDQVIYVGNSARGAGVGKLFRSSDFGDTWEDISGLSQGEDRGFPDAAVFDVIEMPYNDQIIWVSTDIGIVCSVNGGQSWALLDTDLPPVQVRDMQIVNDQVVLATFGRGIWSVTIPELADVDFDPINYISEAEVYQPVGTRQVIIYYAFANNKPNYSVDVLVNGEVLTTLDSDPRQGTYTFEPDNTESRVDTVSFVQSITVGYCQEQIRTELVKLLTYVDYLPTEFSYQNDFESGGDDFISFGNAQFTVSTPEDLDDNVLHNQDIPYSDDAEYISYLRNPIVVTNDTMFYDNIAFVQERRGDINFDFVVVEATKDGREWAPVIDPYDALKNILWSGTSSSPSENYFAQDTIVLSEFFNVLDTIALRFRLSTNSSLVAWGWAIDSIRINLNAVGLSSITPNPSIAEEGDYMVFDIALEGENENDIQFSAQTIEITPNQNDYVPNEFEYSIDNGETWTRDEDPTSITLVSGVDSLKIRLKTTEDDIFEQDDTLSVELSTTSPYLVFAQRDALGVIANDDQFEAMSLFPNPFSNILNILINDRTPGQVGVLIYNESGRIVYRGSFRKGLSFAQESINLRYLATGFYVVVITTSQGTKRHKVLKQ